MSKNTTGRHRLSATVSNSGLSTRNSMHSLYQPTLPPRGSQPTAGFTSIEALCLAFSSNKTPKETEREPTRVQRVSVTTGNPTEGDIERSVSEWPLLSVFPKVSRASIPGVPSISVYPCNYSFTAGDLSFPDKDFELIHYKLHFSLSSVFFFSEGMWSKYTYR